MKEALSDVALEALFAYGPILLACVIYGLFRVWQVWGRGK